MAELAIPVSGPYGAIELKEKYRKYMRNALIFAVLLHFIGVGVYWLTIYLSQDDEPTITVRILKYSELGPPPSINDNASAPAIAVSGPAVKPTIGIPVAVPDAEISPEQTFATQQEMASVAGPVGEGTGGTQIQADLKIDENAGKQLGLDDGPPADFVAYEKEPIAIKQVQPKYPDLAIRAEIEGTVYLKVWVDKEGKVRKAVVLKSDAEIFNQPAIDAATQWVFTPALQQKRPIDVWVAIPFRFRLKDVQK